MMTNLFSIFDPSSATLSLNWIMILFPLLIITPKMIMSTKQSILFLSLKNYIEKEVKSMMESNWKKSSIQNIFSIFMLILILNLCSMFPFNFTIASQISFTFPASMSIWLSFLILGWSKSTKHMMAHLLPLGTPPILMPIMVMIEMISQIIRPITLSVRLTANMVAGHLLMSLLGSFSLMTPFNLIMSSPLILMLTFLELCVSAIQAFVFMTLLTLYSTEIN